jgi:formylglycine-generating enzyme required for sulfatase activity
MKIEIFFLTAVLACAGLAACGQGPGKPPKQAAPAIGKVAIEWVTIPGGTFTMGSEDWPDSKPRHAVTVKTFQMAKTKVTFGQYKKCVEAGPCTAAHTSDRSCTVWDGWKWDFGTLPDSFRGDDQPVVCVNWEQAQRFAKWAGGRLPTEAEWEYAARSGGKDRKYPWGNEEATCERAVIKEGEYGCGKISTWPVCSKSKGNTEQGLCDMSGNAWEWVQDWYYDSYIGAPTDGSARETPPGEDRVSRGGSWVGDAGIARVYDRIEHDPIKRDSDRGFRLSRSP